jgi:hypothetical protein
VISSIQNTSSRCVSFSSSYSTRGNSNAYDSPTPNANSVRIRSLHGKRLHRSDIGATFSSQ